MPLAPTLIAEPYCYLTTIGRVTGRPHEIEIWFGHARRDGADVLYLMSGGRDASDWVRNLMREPVVSVRIAEQTYRARARLIAQENDEDALARRLLFDKYAPGYSGDLAAWRESALPVALDLER
ncbi:MAG: nitroreductase/quinone reductase family protein [Dehalococcoidia bacterium]